MALQGLSRDDIRDDTVSKIVAASTAAGSRVYVSRTRPTTTAEMPLVMVMVHTAADQLRDYDAAAGTCLPVYLRTTQVVCECQASTTAAGSGSGADADDDLQAALDLSDDVLDALLGSSAWLRGTDRTGAAAGYRHFEAVETVSHEVRAGQDGDRRYGAVRVTLSCQHEVQHGT